MQTIKYLLILLLTISFSCKKSQKKEIADEKLADFNYSPTKPSQGKLLGIIELGAAGFNSFIVNVDKDLNWESIKKEYGESLIVEGMTNTDLVQQKLKDYIKKTTAFGLSKKDIHFVVSSGAAKEEITEIISKELNNIGYDVNTFSIKEEGEYALKAIIPKNYINNSFVVDIGSGNTIISYFNSKGEPVTLETHGAKYYQKGIENDDVFKDVKKVIAKVPMQNRVHCFVIGGVPYLLAKNIRKKEERYTILSKGKKNLFKLEKKEIKKVKCGFEIYEAIHQEANPDNIIFEWDANFSIGFLLEKHKNDF